MLIIRRKLKYLFSWQCKFECSLFWNLSFYIDFFMCNSKLLKGRLDVNVGTFVLLNSCGITCFFQYWFALTCTRIDYGKQKIRSFVDIEKEWWCLVVVCTCDQLADFFLLVLLTLLISIFLSINWLCRVKCQLDID